MFVYCPCIDIGVLEGARPRRQTVSFYTYLERNNIEDRFVKLSLYTDRLKQATHRLAFSSSICLLNSANASFRLSR